MVALRLFEHNEKAYHAAVWMMEQYGKAAIVHPTGTGKSYIAFKLIEDNPEKVVIWLSPSEASVYKGYKRDKIEMRGDRAEMSDFPLYLNTVAGGLDRRDQTIGGFSFVVKIYAVPVVEIIG